MLGVLIRIAQELGNQRGRVDVHADMGTVAYVVHRLSELDDELFWVVFSKRARR